MCCIAAGAPVWPDQLDERERAALRPGVPDGLVRRPDVLVVGGGVQGLAAAMACHELGLGRVLLIERDHLAAGPSGSAAGALCPDSHLDVEGPAFVEFARSSLARYEALAAEAGPELRLRWLDWLLVGDRTGESAVEAVPGVQRLDAAAVRRLVPALGIETSGLLQPRGQAHVNPQRLAAVLAARGGAVATGVEYLGLRVAGGRAEAVHTSHGDLQPGAVIIATGLAPPGLLPVERLRFKGHLAATGPVPGAIPVALSAPGGTVTPLEDGRLLVGGDRVPDDGLPEIDPATVRGFGAELDRLLPAVSAGEFTHAWSCARPATADRLPVVDRAPGLDNVWVTVGHYTTGVLLAPATGHALATWIATGEAPAAAAQFRLRPA
jgi:glycine/D-amino acid oxidase-like deaminating enzyme